MSVISFEGWKQITEASEKRERTKDFFHSLQTTIALAKAAGWRVGCGASEKFAIIEICHDAGHGMRLTK